MRGSAVIIALAFVALAGCKGKLVEVSVDSTRTTDMIKVPGGAWGTYSMPEEGSIYLVADLDVRYTRCDGAGEIPATDLASEMSLPAGEGMSWAVFYSALATLETSDGKKYKGKGGTDGPTGEPCVDCMAINMKPCTDGAQNKMLVVFEIPKSASTTGAAIHYRDGRTTIK